MGVSAGALRTTIGLSLCCLWLALPIAAASAAGELWFEEHSSIDPAGAATVTGIVLRDVDGDVDDDILFTSANTSQFSVYKNDGSGHFSHYTSLGTAGHGMPTALETGYFDGDGDFDHVVGTTSGEFRRTFGTTDGGILAPGAWVSLGGITYVPHELKSVITVGDTRADLLVTIPNEDQVQFYRNDGAGGFSAPPTQVLNTGVGSSPRGICTGRFNNDGYRDFAVACYGTDRVRIYLGQSDGTFAFDRSITVGDGPWAITVGGFNNDYSAQEMVVTSLGDGRVTFLWSNGAGGWTQEPHTVGGQPWSIALGSWDLADHRTDIAVVDATDDRLRFFRQGTEDAFAVWGHAPAIDSDARVVEASGWDVYSDLTGDGKVDLAVGGGDLITILRNSSWPALRRLAGDDRYATSVAVSQEAFAFGAENIVVATGEDFPDALAGAGLAGMVDGPVLLTSREALPSSVSEEVERLGPDTAYVLGGSDVVGIGVVDDLLAAGVSDVRRLAGDDRYATATRIAREMEEYELEDIRFAFVATGENFPDALAAGPLAAAWKMPILLTRGDSLPTATQEALTGLGATDTWVLGGPDVVGPAVYDALPNPTRLSGADRYATARAIAEWGLMHGAGVENLCTATGENFPDALSLCGISYDRPYALILTREKTIPAPTMTYVDDHMRDASLLTVAGGDDVVSEDVAQMMRTGYP
jgi:putative cell wall-binding protein